LGVTESSSTGNTTESKSIVTVVIAFGANLLVAIAKTVAALLTSSASMVAEAAHSWADAGNEVFLLVAERRSSRKPDVRHPLGYGREAYVWSMFAAFGLFAVGAAVSVMHGVQQLFNPERGADYAIAYIVLAVAFVLEGISFVQALRQVTRTARKHGRGTLEHVLESSNPTLRAVFAEDAAALIGLVIAFLGILLHELTGLAVFDAIGSILVGVLLGVVAIVLIDRNRRFLVGQSADAATRDAVLRRLLERDDIERVTYLHMEFVGPSQLYLVAAVDLTGNQVESEVALELREIERRLEAEPYIAEVRLTPSVADDVSLTPAEPPAKGRAPLV
jgi:cation diffusion facilitator family transporter